MPERDFSEIGPLVQDAMSMDDTGLAIASLAQIKDPAVRETAIDTLAHSLPVDRIDRAARRQATLDKLAHAREIGPLRVNRNLVLLIAQRQNAKPRAKAE